MEIELPTLICGVHLLEDPLDEPAAVTVWEGYALCRSCFWEVVRGEQPDLMAARLEVRRIREWRENHGRGR